MNIFEYFNYIINNTLGINLIDAEGLYTYFTGIENWSQLFNPSIFLSAFAYIMVGIGLFQLCCIYPFRLLKKLIQYPSRKAVEK